MSLEKPTIFFSVGSPHTDEQETLIQGLEQFLIDQGFNPQTVGRTYFANQQPLKSVEQLMHLSSGIVVVALERTYVESAVEKRNSPKEKGLVDAKLPTVWNQIEAAMAYSIGLPMLVLAEEGIKSEGLIEAGYDWYVKWFNVEQDLFNDRIFLALFESWKTNALAYNQSKLEEADEQNASVPQISKLTFGSPKHLTQLRQILSEKFSEDELRTFVFDLGEDYESLPGSSKPIKAMELVAKMNRYEKLNELIELGKETRTDISWD